MKSVPFEKSLAFKFPDIAAEWLLSRNGGLTPNLVFPTDSTKYWWKCSQGEDHIWEASPKHRTRKDVVTKCPFCNNKKVCGDNSLKAKFPLISEEWCYEKNKNITPEQVLPLSTEKYWWECLRDKKHVWEARPDNRVRGSKCPFCSHRKLAKETTLANYTDIANEWHPTLNGDTKQDQVFAKSNTVYWWKCPEGDDHVWEAQPNNRTSKNRTGCPFCKNKKVSKNYSFLTIFPNTSKEWHPEKNGNLLPEHFLPFSHKKVWWKCSKNEEHVWEACLSSRANGSGCPLCLFKAQEECRDLIQRFTGKPFPLIYPKFLQGLSYDGGNDNLKIAFEYDGEYHERPHWASKDPENDLKKTKERDAKKNLLSKEHGWILIRIHYSDRDRLEEVIFDKIKSLNLLSEKGYVAPIKIKKPKANCGRNSKRPIVDQNGVIYSCVYEAAKKLTLNKGHIFYVCKGKRTSTGGYRFRYLDENC